MAVVVAEDVVAVEDKEGKWFVLHDILSKSWKGILYKINLDDDVTENI